MWYPINELSLSEVQKHPWCLHCGELKNISDDRPEKSGYWMNVLSRLVSDFNITQVQRRLIANCITEDEGFSNLYGVTGSAQKQLFIRFIVKFTSLSKKDVEHWLES